MRSIVFLMKGFKIKINEFKIELEFVLLKFHEYLNFRSNFLAPILLKPLEWIFEKVLCLNLCKNIIKI